MSVRRFFAVIVAVPAAVWWLLVAPTAAAAAPTTLYVAVDGSDTNACTTKAEPCRTINQAIALAPASGATIHVATGLYDGVTPGSKNVTVVGVRTNDPNAGTIIDALGASVVVNDPAGVLTLKSLALAGDPVGAYVTAGKLRTADVFLGDTSCAIFMTDGHVTLRDSTVKNSGIAESPDCSSLTNSPVAVTVNGGSFSMVRSSLTDTKDEPGIVVNGGTFSATDSVFSDLAYAESNNNATVQNAGGIATIKRSLFQNDVLGLQLTGGSTSITDSTFYNDEFGISAVGGGHQPSVFRSTFVDAQLVGPAVLAGDVLTNQFTAACSEEPTDMGYNYGTRGGCTFNSPTSHNGVATLNLDTVAADHGGPTATVAMTAPSALINTIPADATWGPEHEKLCPPGATDQRGVGRPQGGGCDVGAFEVNASQTIVKATPNPASPGKTVTLTAKIIADTGTFHDPDPVAGKVTFKTGSTLLCSGKAVNSSGVATCVTTKLPTGTPTVTARFASTSAYLNSTGTSKVSVGTAPKFTSPTKAKATIGKDKTITVHASAAPAPTITMVGGTLPKGMKFAGGKGRATIAGTPARGTAKKYVLHLRAGNVRGRTTQTFTLTVVAG
jgi:hypothetical protein